MQEVKQADCFRCIYSGKFK